MLHKNFPFEFKNLDEAGTFEATVAVFGNVDKGGDRIIRGAFKKTLAAWAASGDPIPVIFNHDWGTPDAHIGVVSQARETRDGLHVTGRLDVDDNPVARQVHRLMMRRSLKEFSFGYSVPEGGSRRTKDGVTELLELELAEVGPTLKGMNPSTELHSVKNAVLGENDLQRELQEVKATLADVRAELEDLKRSKAEATDEEPVAVRSVDPLRRDSDRLAIHVATGSVPRPASKPSRTPATDELKARSRDLILGLLSERDGK